MASPEWIVAIAIGLLGAMRLHFRRGGISMSRLWIAPALVGVGSAAALWWYPPTSLLQSLVLAAALFLGAALGGLRGWVTHVHFDPRAGRFRTRLRLAMAPALLAVVGLRFAARYGLRSGVIAGMATVSVTASAFLMLGMIGARQAFVYLKLRHLQETASAG
jgi:Na+/proline symporter